MSAVARFLARFPEAKKAGREWLVKCPAHRDLHPSLSITQGDSGLVFRCRSGCEQASVLAELERMSITPADLFDFPRTAQARTGMPAVHKEVAEWIYRLHGQDHHRTVRVEPGRNGKTKEFFVYRADGRGGWTRGLGGTVRIVYRHDDVVKASATTPILWAEGERKADLLVEMGFKATSTMGGAGQIKKQVLEKEFLQPFRDRNVVLVPDNDPPGEEYARTVAQALDGIAASVRVLRLPNLPPKGDVVDWVAAGGTANELQRLLAESLLLKGKSNEPTAARVPPKWKTPGEQARELGSAGPPTPTGFPTLDRITRGGFRPGVVVIGGAPGAGKTTLLCQLALGWAQPGHAVAILAADEENRGLLIRIGQALGFDRGKLEDGDHNTRNRLADRLDAHPALALLDGNDVFVEDVVENVIGRSGGKPAFVLVDSIQTVRAHGTEDADGPRARVDAVMGAFKSAARMGVLVVATCELNRGSYRSQRPEDRTEDLAAFKESGGIEYGATLAVLMRSLAGESDLVDVAVAKNRWGQKDRLRLKLDRPSATFCEVAIPAGGSPGGEPNSEAQLEADVEAVREALRRHPGIAGNDKLVSLVPGFSKKRARTAVRTLDSQGEIENRGIAMRPKLHLRTVLAQPAGNPPNPPGDLAGTNPPNPPHPYRGAGCGAGSVLEARTQNEVGESNTASTVFEKASA